MSALPSWNRYPGRFTIVFGAIMLLLFALEHINGRFWLNDFRVYYGAGEALWTGEPLYGVAHGLDSGVFKYAPLLASLYALFTLLPYSVAASLQYILIAFAFLDGSRRIDRLVRERLLGGPSAASRRQTNYWPLFLTGLVCVVHLHRELNLGNINMMLLWLLLVAQEKVIAGKHALGGILLGGAILAKPHFVVLLPLLLLRGKYRTTGMALAAIVIGVLLPSLFLGPAGNLEVHRSWLGAMAEHNAALIYTGGDDYRSVNTVYSFLHRAVLKHFMGPSAIEAYALLGLIASGFGAFVLWNKRRNFDPSRTFTFEFLLLVALVPSITLTDTEHFLLAMPLIAYLMQHLLPRSMPRWLPWVSIPILFAYGGNWEDALGPLSDRMIHYGVLGIGSFALLITCTALFLRSNHSVPKVS